jgi:hypothetical protein
MNIAIDFIQFWRTPKLLEQQQKIDILKKDNVVHSPA